MTGAPLVVVHRVGKVTTIMLNRPERRNAIDGACAAALTRAFTEFDQDETTAVAVLHGAGGNFCAGADLKSFSSGAKPPLDVSATGPLGATRLHLSKPVIAAVEGFAVAGGLELACWADLRVGDPSSIFGVFCRRFGVPLIDGGTVRLPRLIGHSRAMDMILTGRSVAADEALSWGLLNRVAPAGKALDAAVDLAKEICEFPQLCMRNDRLNAIEQWGVPLADACVMEHKRGLETIQSGETLRGAERFSSGQGRSGSKL
jgi:enoyl-CoA hydratase